MKENAKRMIYGRLIYIAIALLLQIGIFAATMMHVYQYQGLVFYAFTLLAFILVIFIINQDMNPSFKITWIIPILSFPVFGAMLYLFVHLQSTPKKLSKRIAEVIEESKPYLQQDPSVMEHISKTNRQAANLSHYLFQSGGYPTVSHTTAKYFATGEEAFDAILAELEKAQHFIFMEFFIVAYGHMWNSVLNILKRKVEEGVEVRFLYDGTNSVVLLPYDYPKYLESIGIQCKMFSPVRPVLSTYQNNRDHRKIISIDGQVGFTGGLNLADEYINKKVKYGHWKDNAIQLNGDAVRNLTVMFLQMWNITEKNPVDYANYMPTARRMIPSDGFVCAYGDSPLDHENIGEQVYLDIINTAKDYVHIVTPYLIIDNEMKTALTYAAKRGVDVKIVLPHIPDKKYAFCLAHSHYPELLKHGVQIYEYEPGFIHQKTFVSDNEKAVVGSINLDYRSLYLHFECAIYLYQNSAVLAVEKDFSSALEQCIKMTMKEYKQLPPLHRLAGSLLKFLAPLM
ncbi:MAG: cardiolipin synthase [Lachnospiraceae bacterium]